MAKSSTDNVSYLMMIIGVICVAMGAWMYLYMQRTHEGFLPDQKLLRTVGSIVALEVPESELKAAPKTIPPDGSLFEDPKQKMEKATISYIDRAGKEHLSAGMIQGGLFRIGDKVIVEYDPDNPEGEHRLVGKRNVVAMWEFLVVTGLLLVLVGLLELRPPAVRRREGK